MNLRLFLLLVVFSCSFSSAQNNPVPLVSQPLFPASAQPGSPAFVLTVTGTGFAPTAVVQWNRSARLTTFISSSKLQASIRTSDVANAGTALVTVVNPAPAGGQS